MSEPIIIDGVDVSGCVCFAHHHAVCTSYGEVIKDITNSCTTKQKPCGEIRNCLFKKQHKQLQRLEAENKEIKAKLSTAETAYTLCLANKENRHKREIAELENQTEKLKKQNEALHNHISDLLQQLNDMKEAQNEH